MKYNSLDPRTESDIDASVQRILRDLGDPSPPLRLELVRELLRIDRAFYSSSDTGPLHETLHRLRIAGHQLVLRPSLLLDVVKRMDLRALWLPDRSRILIDSELPPAKVRWAEAHEVGHSIIPWHASMLHGDKERTLSRFCHSRLEGEANFAAGRLLFLQDRFTREVRSSRLSFALLRSLSKAYGNTLTSTLWRAVESSDKQVFALIADHPGRAWRGGGSTIRHFVASKRFAGEFGSVEALPIFSQMVPFCSPNQGPIGEGPMFIVDGRGETHHFHFQAFFNGYDALVLAEWQRRIEISVPVIGGRARASRV